MPAVASGECIQPVLDKMRAAEGRVQAPTMLAWTSTRARQNRPAASVGREFLATAPFTRAVPGTQTTLAFAAVTTLFFAWGFITSLVDPLVASVKGVFTLTNLQ